MSLRDVMAYLQKHHGPGAAVTPVTPSKCEGLQPEPAWTGRVPPVTPAFNDAGLTAQKSEPDEAPAPAPELLDWRALDRAHQAHHVRCPVCIAAGRGTRYGLRCGLPTTRPSTRRVYCPGNSSTSSNNNRKASAMIDALIAGKVFGQPAERTSKAGKVFAVAKVRAAGGDGEVMFVSVIAFDAAPCTALLALGDGDSVALSGSLTPKVCTDKECSPAASMLARVAGQVGCVRYAALTLGDTYALNAISPHPCRRRPVSADLCPGASLQRRCRKAYILRPSL